MGSVDVVDGVYGWVEFWFCCLRCKVGYVEWGCLYLWCWLFFDYVFWFVWFDVDYWG